MNLIRHSSYRLPVLLASALLSGCVTYPSGPSMLALPGTSTNFEQFRGDDFSCQSYAQQATGQTSAQQAATDSGVNSAAAGTVVGAAAGALLGAASGNPAAGAAIGAGGGLLVGSAAGTDAYGASGYGAQDRYDNAYIQCMYAKGHQVPVPAEVAAAQYSAPAYPAPPVSMSSYSAPAPAGAYPPPGTPPPPGY